MAHDELAAKLRRDAIGAARRTARAFSWLAEELEELSVVPVATDLLGQADLHELIEKCAQLRLLLDLDREGK